MANDESQTKAVTLTPRRRQGQERARRLAALSQCLRENYDTRPVTKAEWDAACGDGA